MQGYLLNFYKFSPAFPMGEKDNAGFRRSITWSNFDRIEIRPITEFADYRTTGKSEKDWMGERQFAMIYEFDSKEYYRSLEYKKEEESDTENQECRFAFQPRQREIGPKRFFGITFLDFKKEAHQYFYSQEKAGAMICQTIHEAIDKIVADTDSVVNENILYEIYGILGGEDLVIIWLTDQVTDIAKIIEGLRKSRTTNHQPIFSNIYTIVGLSDVNNEAFSYENAGVTLNVKLTKSDNFDGENVKGILRDGGWKESEQKPVTLFGEYDILFRWKEQCNLAALYKRDGIFNAKSPDFAQNFLQSKTEVEMEYDTSEIFPYNFDICVPDRNLEEEKLDPRRYKNKFEEILEAEFFDNLSYLKESLWLLYEDYLKNVTSYFSYPWAEDLEYQFEECLNSVECIVESDEDKKDKYSNIRELVAGMRQMMLHVAQANRVFFEIPQTHLRQTGAYSKILYTYYGIIKEYLNIVYAISRCEDQLPIVPFLSFDVTPIVDSTFLKWVKGSKSNIICFNLPYEALTDIPKYAKLMAHEIYHYVAPDDRTKRNLLMGAAIIADVMGQMVRVFLEKYECNNVSHAELSAEDKRQIDEIVDMAEKITLSSLNSDEYWKKYIDISNKNAEWKIFYEDIMRHIDNFVQDAALCRFLHIILHNATQGVSAEKKWMEKINAISPEKLGDLFAGGYMDDLQPRPVFLQYSLREAMADCFMIQVTKMEIGLYMEYLMDHKRLVASDEGSMIQQNYRISLVLDWFHGDEICTDEFWSAQTMEQKMRVVASWLKTNLELSKKDAHIVTQEYTRFKLAFRNYQPIFNEYFKMLDFEKIPKYNKGFSSAWENLQNKLKLLDSYCGFEKNIQYIETFQSQETLRNVSDRADNKRQKSYVPYQFRYSMGDEQLSSLVKDYDMSGSAMSLSELFGIVKEQICLISDEGSENPIWYRGQKSIKHCLIPSLYRMQDKNSKSYNTDFRSVLRDLEELFKAKAYNAPELLGDIGDSEVKCLISMQHYSIPTNILDWTTSIMVSLYFALEDELDPKAEKTDDDAVIYLLNPIRMNTAFDLISNMLRPHEVFPIPAFDDVRIKFGQYLTSHNAAEINSEREQYPRAVYAPYVNQRIKAQKGTFVLFGLDNRGNLDDQGDFLDNAKFSLWKLQEKYKKRCESEGWQYCQFLTRIKIYKQEKHAIAKLLNNLGVNKSEIYPELDKIAGHIFEEMDMFLKHKIKVRKDGDEL